MPYTKPVIQSVSQPNTTAAAIEGNGQETVDWAPAAAKMMSKKKQEMVPQLRFPPGFRFLPTELELVDVYLRGKIDGRKPPLDVFMDVNILEWEPAKLVAERKAYGEGRYFFFTVREASPSNKNGEPRRKLRVPGVAASWKATGSVAEIRRSGTDEVVGTKRILTYHSSDDADDNKWSMNEYVLADRPEMDQWVLCTIQEKLHWDANHSKGKKFNRTDTRMERKTTKRKKTATSQQQQQQQMNTPDVSSDPPPLLTHEQSRHHALHKEDIMALDETSLMIQVAATQEYPDGDQHYLDTSTQQETTYEGLGELPLMTHQQPGYQASQEAHHHLEFEGTSLNSIAVHHQFETARAQYMLEHHFNTMVQVHPQELMLQCQGNQQQPSYTDQFFPPVSRMEHAQYQYQLSQQQIPDPLRTQGFHRNFIGTSQNVLQFPQESAKPSMQRTSPDSLLGGLESLAYPGL